MKITLYNDCKKGREPKYAIINKVNPFLCAVYSSKGYWKENIKLDTILFGAENVTACELSEIEDFEIKELPELKR